MNDEPLITSRVVSSNLQDDALLERPIDEGFSVVRQEQEQDRSIQMEHQALRNQSSVQSNWQGSRASSSKAVAVEEDDYRSIFAETLPAADSTSIPPVEVKTVLYVPPLQPPPPIKFYKSTIVETLTKEGLKLQVKYSSDEHPNPEQLFVTHTKEAIIHKFGDVLAFEMFSDVRVIESPTSEFWLGLLVAFDTNCRALIAGMLLFRNDHVHNLFKSLKLILRSKPKLNALLTNSYPSLLRAIRNLKELGIFQGAHLLDQGSVLDDLQRELDELGDKLPAMEKAEALSLFRQIINQRNQDTALKLLQDVCSKICPAADDIIINFLNRKQQVCSWAMPATFTGFNFTCSKEIQQLVRQFVPPRISPLQLLEALDKINSHLSARYIAGSFYKEDTELAFRDARIGPVRQNIEATIFEYFLRNYVSAVKEWRLLTSIDHLTDKRTIQVYNRFTRFAYDVSEGTCNCTERIHTGVPCCHLLCKLISEGDSDYLAHFAVRWRRSDTLKMGDTAMKDSSSTIQPQPTKQAADNFDETTYGKSVRNKRQYK